MTKETKRDVFKVAMNHAAKSGWVDYSEMMSRYTTALPDDLPVIPKKVSSWIEYCYGSTNLLGILLKAMETYRTSEVMAWVVSHHESVALAWVLGAWRVEETGEIVKLKVKK